MNLTPVEVLQREIEAFRAKKQLLKGDPARAGITIHVPVFEAMLELAKADADLEALKEAEWADEWRGKHDKWLLAVYSAEESLKASRTNIYEALQR